MTNGFRGKFPCPTCRTEITWEEPYKTELRKDRRLDSREHCIVIGDCDLIVYRYGMKWSPELAADRHVRWHMIVEVKTWMEEPDRSQAEALWLTGHLMTTSREWSNERNGGQFIAGHEQNVRQVKVDMRRFGGAKDTWINSYGTHLLQMNHRSFAESSLFHWDRHPVSRNEVFELLAFDRNPMSRLPLDRERMHKKLREQPAMLF